MSNDLRFDKAVLGNGLTVIGEYNPRAVSAAVGYLVNAGSRDETPDIAGVSHFLEHMMFKGNERVSAEDMNRLFDELGADYNAYTSEERTVYYGAVTADRAFDLLDLLTELVQPSLRQSDFDMEKNVILEEIAMYQDRPSQRLFEAAKARFWNGHPLGNSVLGSVASVTGTTREAMHKYFEQRYAPSNMHLVLAGNYDWHDMLARAEQGTAALNDFNVSRSLSAPQHSTGTAKLTDPTLNRVHTAVSAPGLPNDYEHQWAPGILARAIGDGAGSRLYWELVDKGLCDSAWLSHEASDGAGQFLGYISASPERAEEVLAKYLAVLNEVQQNGLTEEEWRRAKRKIATSMTFWSETPLGRLMTFGTLYQTVGKYLTANDLVTEVMNTPLSAGLKILGSKPFDSTMIMTLGPT